MKKQTFILEINDTQNGSWQGQLEWIQGREKQYFRSVMELLELINSTMENRIEGGVCEQRKR